MSLYLQTYVNLNGQNMQYFSIGNFPTTCHIWWKITKVKGKKNKGKYFFTKTNLAVNLFHLKVYSAHLYSVNTTKLASNTKSLEIFFPRKYCWRGSILLNIHREGSVKGDRLILPQFAPPLAKKYRWFIWMSFSNFKLHVTWFWWWFDLFLYFDIDFLIRSDH